MVYRSGAREHIHLLRPVESLVQYFFEKAVCICNFTYGTVTCTSRMNSDIIERTEMTPNTSDLLLENFVIESGLELSLSCAGGSNVHGGLSTTQDYVVFHR